MSQETSRESTGSSKLPGQVCETSNLTSLSGEMELRVAIQGPVTEMNDLKQLVNEFRGLYEQRLRHLELDTGVNQEEVLQKKVNFLRSYVNDLADQNQVLVQTVEDLQKEADDKVSNWVPEVDLSPLLVGPAAHAHTHSIGFLVQIASELEDLKIQLQTKDVVISDLETELRENLEDKQKAAAQELESSERLSHLQSELTCLQRLQKDNVKEVAEKDVCVAKLHAHVQLLQQEEADARAQLCILSARAEELQEELRRRRGEDEGRLRRQKGGAEGRRRREQRRGEEEQKKREEEWQSRIEEERKAHADAVRKWAEEAAVWRSEVKEREGRVRHLDQDLAGSRAAQDSLQRTLTLKEKQTQQLVQDNMQLRESLASVQSKLRDAEAMLSGAGESLDRAGAEQEVERLQQEVTRVRRAAEKKIQKREMKVCELVRELTERKELLSDCENELLQREAAAEKLREERDELRAKMEERGRECVHLNQTKERLEADLALSHEKVHTSHLEVRSRDQLILQLRAEIKMAGKKQQRTQEQVASLEDEVRNLKAEVRGQQEEACQLRGKVRDIERLEDQREKEQQQLCDRLCVSQQQVATLEETLKKREEETQLLHQELENAGVKAQGQSEAAAIFKHKYTAAMEKVHKVQRQVELLQEELRFSQQQLRDSQSAARSAKDELSETLQRYQLKVGQWEDAQEALDQLADELQASQNLLSEREQEVDGLRGLVGPLQEQKLLVECDLRRRRRTHSHSDEEYLSLLRHTQQLQKRCTEQVERLAECEKAILQMKSELERQTRGKESLEQSLAASHRAHTSHRSQLGQEVLRLKQEVTRLELELADTQKGRAALLRRSEEALEEAARRSGEVRGLREELLKREELHGEHRVAVEELAARAEEARRMEGRLNEGKLAEGKIRSMAARLQAEVAELRRNLQAAVDHKMEAGRAERDAQEQVDRLRSELAATRSDNANLRSETELVMTNVNSWISEQKASNESLAAQTKAQNKLLLIVTEEKERLQEANDTLKAEAKRLKEVADEKQTETELFKAQIRDQANRQDDRHAEKLQSRAARSLGKMEDMQARLRRNLEAVGMLNQQLNALSGENKRLRRQLEQERSMRLRPPPPPPPPTSQQRSSVHLPFSLRARPPPPSPSPSLPSSDMGH